MNRLQLATLLSWAGEGGLQGRKRLQKVVYFLQAAGCPLDCRYTLHHFGPYSRDVAETCDESVAAGLVEELGGPVVGGMGSAFYVYSLKPEARRFLEQGPDAAMQPFRTLGCELIRADLWQLELGSTILFFHGRNGDWEQALTEACQFKRVDRNLEASRNAMTFAQRVLARQVN